MSSSVSSCPRCGAALRSSAARGLCPRCVLASSLAPEVPTDAEHEVRRFADFELLRELGRGGMGVVYEARQASLGRVVALKMLLPARLGSASELERFRFEAEGIAALDHPNILPIYAIGSAGGQPYFIMKLAEGGSLAERLHPPDGRAPVEWPAGDAANLLATIAHAVHYAHERGIQHRDLKPGNILLDAAGRPYVGDFGLAKFRDKDSGLTLSTSVLGSPAYMSPEQANGDSKRVTTASDVYSLGAILYEVLCGRPPFVAATALETLRQVIECEPAPPSHFRKNIPRDLEVICLQCLHKEPSKRYASAEALAQELERWLAGEPILARPASTAERLARWCMRRPALTGTLLALLVALGAGVAGVALQWRRAEQHARDLEAERYAADMQVASQAFANYDLGLVRRTLRAQVPRSGEADWRGFEWHLLQKLSRGDELLTFTGHTATVTCVAVSPDGTTLASGGMDGMLRIWNATSGALLRSVPVGSVVWSVAFTPKADRLITGEMNGKIRFWSRDGHEVEAPLPGQNFALTPDGGRLVASMSPPFKYFPASDGVTVWDLANRTKLAELKTSWRRVAISPDGRRIAGAGRQRDIHVHDLEAGTTRVLTAQDAAWSLAFSPEGERLAASGFDLGALVWDLRGTNAPLALTGHDLKIWAVAFSPNGRQLATTGSDRTLRLHNLDTLQQLAVFMGHEDEIWSVLWPTKHRLFTTSKDMTLRAWDTDARQDDVRLTNFSYWTPQISPDGQNVLCAESPRDLVVRDGRDGTERKRFRRRWAGAFDADGAGVLLLDDYSHALEYWRDGRTNRVPLQGAPARFQMRDFAFSADKAAVAVVSAQQVFAWSVSDGHRIAGQLQLPSSGRTSLALSRQGRHVAIGLEDPYVIVLHEIATGQTRLLTNHTEGVKGVAFSPDGEWLASAALDRVVRLWRVRDGTQQAELIRYFEEATGVAFSPDGRLLASIGEEQSVNLWHLPTRREVLSLRVPEATARIGFSPRGDALIFTTRSNIARLLQVR
jgi:eukaryotic-like serine/threonine-protein kinase